MVFLLIFTFLQATSIARTFHFDGHLDPRIINGQAADPNQFSFMVQIVRSPEENKTTTLCGGSLISNDWILSAAQCVYGVQYIFVYLGSIYSFNGTKYQIGPDGIIIHPNYVEEKHLNDISLIKIPYSEYSASIKRIELPFEYEDNLLVGKIATTFGWGFTKDGGEPSTTLLYANLKVAHWLFCEGVPIFEPFSQLCAVVDHAQKQSPCDGDAGGPLVIRDSSGDNIQIGIASYLTNKNCVSGFPVIFTRLSIYLQWIQSKTGIVQLKTHPNEIL